MCLCVRITKKSKKSTQPLPLAPSSVHYTGSPVQVYRSENHFGASELRELMRVLATHTQRLMGVCATHIQIRILFSLVQVQIQMTLVLLMLRLEASIPIMVGRSGSL